MDEKLVEKAIEDLCIYEDVMKLSLCAKSRMTGQPVYKETELPDRYKEVMHGLKLADHTIQSCIVECSEIAEDEKALVRDKLEAEVMGEAYTDALLKVRSMMIDLLYTVLDSAEGGGLTC